MATPEHAATLLQAARRDHDALTPTVALRQVTDSIYGLHAQQAVEKALKAWLALREPGTLPPGRSNIAYSPRRDGIGRDVPNVKQTGKLLQDRGDMQGFLAAEGD